jgi:Cu+-exporting ATPase
MSLERSAAPAPLVQTVYTCPMHPEVEQPQGGACPLCGMALEPREVVRDAEADDPELRAMTRRFFGSAALGLPVFLLAMLPMVTHHADPWLTPELNRWLQGGLSTPVVLWGGWPFFARGWRSLVTRRLNMFTLIALGTGAAYLYSTIATAVPAWIPEAFRHHGQVAVYFEAAAMIIVLVLLGQVLELRARRRTSAAIRELLALSPPTARLLGEDGERIVPLAEVAVGDLLRVVPGDRVPVDGKVVQGSSTVDESMMTGESTPVARRPGDRVLGGSVNQAGSFQMRARRIGSDTLLAQIVRLVAQAQRSRAPIQRLADQVAAWFVPAVVLAAAVTFVVWAWLAPLQPSLAYALVNAVAVLIIACPCALGLATPMSIMVGVGRGAQAGILIRDAEVLERLAGVDTLVIDKTGTLTEGRPQVTGCRVTGPWTEMDLLGWAAAVAQASEHPLSGAVVAEARRRGLTLDEVTDFQSTAGGGVTGRVGARAVRLGSASFLRESAVPALDVLEAEAARLQDQGQTVVFVAVDQQAAGTVAVTDPIKRSAPGAVRDLHRMGLRLIMLSGDHERTASAVARSLGIDDYEARVSPQEKHRRIHDLRRKGRTIAMAGDGINDAPALAEADVGIAMGEGSDVAIQSAGITLVQGDLQGIVRAIRLSRRTMRNIRQNLFFAFVYNALGVPIAAGVLYPIAGILLNPMLAAAAMSLSSVSVIANALRLRGAAI